MNIIEELFFGNIDPNDLPLGQDSQYSKAMKVIDAIEDSLAERLEGREQKQYLDLVNAYSEVMGITTVENFINGFRVGARFILDTFVIEPNRILKDNT